MPDADRPARPARTPARGPVRVVVVHAQALMRTAVRQVLETAGDVRVVGECATVADVLGTVPALAPEVLLTDVALPDGCALAAANGLLEADAALAVVVLGSVVEPALRDCATDVGVRAMVSPRTDGRRVLDAVRRAAASRSPRPPAPPTGRHCASCGRRAAPG